MIMSEATIQWRKGAAVALDWGHCGNTNLAQHVFDDSPWLLARNDSLVHPDSNSSNEPSDGRQFCYNRSKRRMDTSDIIKCSESPERDLSLELFMVMMHQLRPTLKQAAMREIELLRSRCPDPKRGCKIVGMHLRLGNGEVDIRRDFDIVSHRSEKSVKMLLKLLTDTCQAIEGERCVFFVAGDSMEMLQELERVDPRVGFQHGAVLNQEGGGFTFGNDHYDAKGRAHGSGTTNNVEEKKCLSSVETALVDMLVLSSLDALVAPWYSSFQTGPKLAVYSSGGLVCAAKNYEAWHNSSGEDVACACQNTAEPMNVTDSALSKCRW